MPETRKKIIISFEPDKLKIPTYALNRWTLCIFIVHPWQAVHSLGVLGDHAVPVFRCSHTAGVITRDNVICTVQHRQNMLVSMSVSLQWHFEETSLATHD